MKQKITWLVVAVLSIVLAISLTKKIKEDCQGVDFKFEMPKIQLPVTTSKMPVPAKLVPAEKKPKVEVVVGAGPGWKKTIRFSTGGIWSPWIKLPAGKINLTNTTYMVFQTNLNTTDTVHLPAYGQEDWERVWHLRAMAISGTNLSELIMTRE